MRALAVALLVLPVVIGLPGAAHAADGLPDAGSNPFPDCLVVHTPDLIVAPVPDIRYCR